MTHKIAVSGNYHCTTTGIVDLSPKTWDDVDEWYVKWDHLNVRFKGETDWQEFDLESQTDNVIDWKRPTSVTIEDEDYNYLDEK